MLGGRYVFYFYLYFAPRFKICSENVRKPINKKLKAHMENKIKYYKICDIKYGIRFLAHLWGAYAIPLALSVVRRESFVVCRLCPP